MQYPYIIDKLVNLRLNNEANKIKSKQLLKYNELYRKNSQLDYQTEPRPIPYKTSRRPLNYNSRR